MLRDVKSWKNFREKVWEPCACIASMTDELVMCVSICDVAGSQQTYVLCVCVSSCVLWNVCCVKTLC